MNHKKVLRLLKQMNRLSEEEQAYFFERSQFPAHIIRQGFYTAQEIAKKGGYTSHKSILQMASDKRYGKWDAVKLSKGIRIFGKQTARQHLARRFRSQRRLAKR